MGRWRFPGRRKQLQKEELEVTASSKRGGIDCCKRFQAFPLLLGVGVHLDKTPLAKLRRQSVAHHVSKPANPTHRAHRRAQCVPLGNILSLNSRIDVIFGLPLVYKRMQLVNRLQHQARLPDRARFDVL